MSSKPRLFLFACTLNFFMLGCKPEQASEQVEPLAATVNDTEVPVVLGSYVTDGYERRIDGDDWVAVLVTARENGKLAIAVRSRADKKSPTCTFNTLADENGPNSYKAFVNGKPVLFIFSESSVSIQTEKDEDSGILNFYCSGGASIAGEYKKVTDSFDNSQLDKTLFTSVLMLQNIGFNISSLQEATGEKLTILPFGLTVDDRAVTHQIQGTVVNAEVEDLNSDGFPEVLIYTQAPDGKGDVIGYSVNNGKSMSQISFPEISHNPEISSGYQGKDEFSIVETTLARRFPIFLDGKETGRIRQVEYKLKDGETSRVFTVSNFTEYVQNASNLD
jgi:hypothetical protein